MKRNTLTDAFCAAFTPPGRFETAEIYTELALKDLRDTSRPERERFNSAIRLLCCIPEIGDRLPDGAMNEIFGRQGVVPAE